MEIGKGDCINSFFLHTKFVHMIISYNSQLYLRNLIGINRAQLLTVFIYNDLRDFYYCFCK